MELRENAGGDKDLFSVQRRMKKEKRRMEQLREKEYQREIRRERSNVFNFINSTLGDKREFYENYAIIFALYLLEFGYHPRFIHVYSSRGRETGKFDGQNKFEKRNESEIKRG